MNLEYRLKALRDIDPRSLPRKAETQRFIANFRTQYGFKARPANLLTPGESNPKTAKSPLPSVIMHLAPANLSKFNTCPWSTQGCRDACLNTAGRGMYDNVQRGRLWRTDLWGQHPVWAFSQFVTELKWYAEKYGQFMLRLNGTSDIRWERVLPDWLIASLNMAGIGMYDYTKGPQSRLDTIRERNMDYTLITSIGEHDNPDTTAWKLRSFKYGAVVVRMAKDAEIPEFFWGQRTIDADAHDLWWMEEVAGLGILRTKGDAINDTSGFVKQLEWQPVVVS